MKLMLLRQITCEQRFNDTREQLGIINLTTPMNEAVMLDDPSLSSHEGGVIVLFEQACTLSTNRSKLSHKGAVG